MGVAHWGLHTQLSCAYGGRATRWLEAYRPKGWTGGLPALRPTGGLLPPTPNHCETAPLVRAKDQGWGSCSDAGPARAVPRSTSILCCQSGTPHLGKGPQPSRASPLFPTDPTRRPVPRAPGGRGPGPHEGAVVCPPPGDTHFSIHGPIGLSGGREDSALPTGSLRPSRGSETTGTGHETEAHVQPGPSRGRMGRGGGCWERRLPRGRHWEAWGRHAVLSHGPAETQWGGSRGLGRQGKEGSRARLHAACPQGAWRSRVGPGVCSGARVPSTAPRAPSWSQRSARLRVPRSTPVPIHPRAEERRR